ncbi:NYN domain-containing protein [Solimonas sp. SE-A11]|uniref:NYN domain-containing protein n=1 Tax=Solimonas sp. SE-A11 TaxID=3054954 RepID=UPI00259D0B02|nr:NYN domain-containing protein [Solimonas sp. SE-A11]MDM4770915.1 NYN domain-containing protein [Solimonas sp. SE-A11]
MDRFAIFVDVGYLMRQALRIVSGKDNATRSELRIIDPAKLIDTLSQQARNAFRHDRQLRTYWYDGVGTTMTPEQTSIAILPDVQFRAGTIHNKKQKGVDSRIVHDLFELASNRAIADALVVTGDGDLAVGIEFAQRRGLRVALLSIEDVPNGVSANRHPELSYLADRQLTLGKGDIDKLFKYEPAAKVVAAKPIPPQAQAVPAPVVQVVAPQAPASIDDQLRAAVKQLIADLPEDTRAKSLNAAGGIVAEIDRQLLAKAKAALGRMLETPERNKLRSLYSEQINQQS